MPVTDYQTDTLEDRSMGVRIVTNPKVLQGKPIIEGARISVAFVLELLASGMTVDRILEEYSNLTNEGIVAAAKCAQ